MKNGGVETAGPSLESVFKHSNEDFIGPIYKQYLDDDRLKDRKLNTSGFAETQNPETNLFPIEAELILNLVDTCQKKGWSQEDILHLLPAVHISLFAHGPQFRNSGEPYFIHPASLAIEAIEEFNADWRTAALALIHDVKEDSRKNNREVPPYLVYKIYTDLFKGENSEHQAQARKDARFLERGMEALHKVRDPKRQTHATEETLKKLCTVFLDKGLDVEDAARIMLIRLLDRRHNLRTISSLPPEKQLEKARETFLYLPFAEALHQYSLRDELARLAIQILDSAEAAYIDSIVAGNNSLKQTYKQNLISRNDVVHAVLEAPGFYETYKALNLDPLGNTERLKLTLVVDDGQNESSKLLEEAVYGDSIQIDIKVVSKSQYIAENSYFQRFHSLDYTPTVGTREEWETASIRNLVGIKERFRQAKKLRNFSDFLETTIAGQKQVYDKDGHPINLHPEDSLFDALWIRYGKDVRSANSTIIEIKGKRKRIERDKFGMTIPEGAKIISIEVGNIPPFNLETVSPEDIRMSNSLSVRRQLVNQLVTDVEAGKEDRKTIIFYGYEFISGDLERAWTKKLGTKPLDFTKDKFIAIPVVQVENLYSQYYQNTDDLVFAIGSGQISPSLYRRLIGELVKIRSDMVYFNLELVTKSLTKTVLDWLQMLFKISPVSLDLTSSVTGKYEFQLWLYESQLGGDSETRWARFGEICSELKRFTSSLYYDWNKIQVIPAEIPEPVEEKGGAFTTIS